MAEKEGSECGNLSRKLARLVIIVRVISVSLVMTVVIIAVTIIMKIDVILVMV